MLDLPETDPASNIESSVDPGAAPGGTSIPFQAERFGSSSHISPSIPVVGVPSHTHQYSILLWLILESYQL